MEKRAHIPGYVGLYQVSDLGRVKSLERNVMRNNGKVMPIKEKILKGWKTGKTSHHYRVTLRNEIKKTKRYTIHRLVYCSFTGVDLNNNKDGYFVLHKNDIKDDNRLENLYMGTQWDNFRDMVRNNDTRETI